jgi:hypothetical protein
MPKSKHRKKHKQKLTKRRNNIANARKALKKRQDEYMTQLFNQIKRDAETKELDNEKPAEEE